MGASLKKKGDPYLSVSNGTFCRHQPLPKPTSRNAPEACNVGINIGAALQRIFPVQFAAKVKSEFTPLLVTSKWISLSFGFFVGSPYVPPFMCAWQDSIDLFFSILDLSSCRLNFSFAFDARR